MNSNKEILSKKRMEAQDKERRQNKIMIVLGIIMAVIVAALGVAWFVYNVHVTQTRKLSESEMLKLFEDDADLPKKDDVLVGQWYYSVGGDVISKYELTATGTIKVYNRQGDDFVLYQSASYRVREKAKTLYVLPDGSAKVVSYEYDIEKKTNDGKPFYTMTWVNGDRGWSMIKVAE